MSVIELRPREPIEPENARALTDSIKRDIEGLWHRLLGAYEQNVHLTLGYPSWGAYCKSEFGTGSSQAYRLLDAGRVARAIEAHSPIGERPNEGTARELSKVLREEGEEALAEVWEEIVDEHGPEPTAEKAREVVEARETTKKKKKLTAQQQEFANALNALELGAEYVQAALRWRSEGDKERTRALLAVDEETRAEWVRQTGVIYGAGSQLRRYFRREGGRQP